MAQYINNKNVDWPVEQKACDPTKALTAPLCNSYVKVVGYYMARPYNFMMAKEYWEEVTNDVELLLAARFGLEIDMNKIPEEMWYRASFHTQQYINFQKYLRQNALKDAAKLVAEFQSDTFALRTTKSIGGFYDFASLILDVKDKISVAKTVVDTRQLIANQGPITINRTMYKKVFNQDYHAGMLEQLRKDGTYKGDGLNDIYKTIGY